MLYRRFFIIIHLQYKYNIDKIYPTFLYNNRRHFKLLRDECAGTNSYLRKLLFHTTVISHGALRSWYWWKTKLKKKTPKNITMDGVLRVKTICVTLVLWISACVLVFADVGLIPGPIVTKAQCRAKCLQEVYNYWCSYSLFDQIYPFSNLYKITFSTLFITCQKI